MLADEPDASQLVNGQHADGPVLEMDDAVDARRPSGRSTWSSRRLIHGFS